MKCRFVLVVIVYTDTKNWGGVQECILGALRSKTVLLVTHQVEFLHGADLILV